MKSSYWLLGAATSVGKRREEPSKLRVYPKPEGS